MEGDYFRYVSVIEGVLICVMLGWEVFWLRRMYKVLQSMPTSEQLQQMVEMIKKDRDSVKDAIGEVGSTFEFIKKSISNFFPGYNKY